MITKQHASFATVLFLAGVLFGCGRSPLSDDEVPSGINLTIDLGPATPKAAAGECHTVIDRAELYVDSLFRDEQTLNPSDTLRVRFEQVELFEGEQVEVRIISNGDDLLYRGSTTYTDGSLVTLPVQKQAPVMWVCPSFVEIGGGEAEVSVINRGQGILNWAAEPIEELIASPSSGEVPAGQSQSVLIVRQTPDGGDFDLLFESETGFVDLPVSTIENLPPEWVEPRPDSVWVTFGLARQFVLSELFLDPEDAPLSFEVFTENPDVVGVGIEGEILFLNGNSVGSTDVAIRVADDVHVVDFGLRVFVFSPDLVPGRFSDGGGPSDFCSLGQDGLQVRVVNRGPVAAGPFFTVSVSFGELGVETFDIPSPFPPFETQDFSVPIPGGCFNPDCDFQIFIDSDETVREANEENNVEGGFCLG